MFDLENAIDDWKHSFNSQGDFATDQIVELEAHLRESISDLARTGLSQREAFIIAADRLGHPTELEQQFRIANTSTLWRKRIFWMLSGYLAMTAASGTISAIAAIAGTGLAIAGVTGGTAAMLMIASTALAWAALIAVAYHQSQRGEYFTHQHWIIVTGILLVAAPVVAFAARVAQTRLVTSAWYGESAIYLTAGGWCIHCCVVILCFIAVFKTRESSIPESA